MMLQEILGERGWKNPDAVNLVMQKFGLSEEQANLMQQQMPDMETVGLKLGVAGRDLAKTQARNSILKEQASWDAIKSKIKTKVAHYTTDMFKDAGVSIRNYFTESWESFVDEATGAWSIEISKRTSNTFNRALSGDMVARKYIQGLVRSGGTGDARTNQTFAVSGMAPSLFSVDKKMMESIAEIGRAQRGGGGYEEGPSEYSMLLEGEGGGRGVSSSTITTENLRKIAGSLRSYASTGGKDASEKIRKMSGGGDLHLLQVAMGRALSSTAVLNANTEDEKKKAISKEMERTVGETWTKTVSEFGGDEWGALAGIQASSKNLQESSRSIDFEKAAQGVEGYIQGKSYQTLNAETKELSKKLAASLKGDSNTFSGAQLEDFVKNDTAIGKVLVGSMGRGGIMDAKNSEELRTILLKTNLNEEDRKKLKEGIPGLSDKALDDLNKDLPTRTKLARTINQPGSASLLKKWATSTDKTAVRGLIDEFVTKSKDYTNILSASGSNATTFKDLSESTKGKSDAYVEKLREASAKYSSETGDMKGTEAGEAVMKEANEMYASLDKETRKKVKGVGQGLGLEEYLLQGEAAVLRKKRTGRITEASAHGGKGRTFEQEGITAEMFGSGEQAVKNYEEAQRISMEDKDKRINAKEWTRIEALIKEGNPAGLTAKEWAKVGATNTTEQQVATAITQISQNNKEMAAYLKEIATGAPAKAP
jgi:hypothetical protein